MPPKKTIAAFDFDGTITTKDTLFDFISFYHGQTKLIKGLVILSPILILYKFGIIRNDKAKTKLFSYFFKDEYISMFNKKCNEYVNNIDRIKNRSTYDKIKKHLEMNHEVIIISASISNWIKPWANKNNISEVMGTEIQINEDKLTGKFSTKNCYGKEKVNRLLQKYPNRKDYILYAYGDSEGDIEIMKYADLSEWIK